MQSKKMHSIVLTVHNKDWLIERVIEGIYKYTAEPYELIVVIDGCTDNSEKIIWDSLSGTPVKRKFVHAPNVFETKANNLGMKIAEGDKIIIVQDDMIIKEQDWNKRLEKPFRLLMTCLPLHLGRHITGYSIPILST